VTLFYDGGAYWLADGFHRHAAHLKAGATDIAADIRQGTRRDAILHSVGANQSHGLRRTNDDKRRAVMTLLNDEEWGKWSAREIAEHCGVSHDFAARLKKSLSSDDSEVTYTTKHGTVATMQTGNIGRPAVTPFDPVQAKEIKEQHRAIRADEDALRLAEKIAKVDRIRERNADLPAPDRKYSVVYADPPWRYEGAPLGDPNRAVEAHYPTLSAEEIKALPVSQLAADDCALLLWATMPKLQEALDVIAAWDFTFKTCAFVWVKQTKNEDGLAWGLGSWTRANAELCLLATKGSPSRLNADVHQVILAPRAEHSRKPDEAAERIMRLVPGPYIELFARRPREGWDVWGNQAFESAA
jgi:N6-adenosine-specific RNA methylase IME4